MFAFVDETGNTGKNLFDKNQPYFITGALVTKSDFDLVYGRAVKKICDEFGIPEVHASKLSNDLIDQVAERFLKIVKKADSRFFISRIEKKYLAATKIFDTIFDSGENEGVAPHIYNIRPLRMMLMFRVATILDIDLAQEFWSTLMEPNETKARARFVEVCGKIKERVPGLPDEKTKEYVRDGLEWAIKNPTAIHMHSNGKLARYGHLPNMVAFGNLLDGLQKQSDRWKRPVKRIKHDRQMQFETSLQRWHELFSNASPDPIFMGGEEHVFQKVFGSEFKISSAKESPGIQVIDVVLWILRRVSDGATISAECGRFLKFVTKRGYAHEFTFDYVSKQFEASLNRILSEEPDAAALEKAKAYLDEEDNRRALALAETAKIEKG